MKTIKKVSELKTKMDFIEYLREHGVTKLPKGWSIKDAINAVEGVELATSKYNKLMDAQSKPINYD